MEDADLVLNVFLRTVLANIESNVRSWDVDVERECPELLSETGDGLQPTSIDVFLESEDAVVCIESKFASDAASGVGPCPQVSGRHSRPGRCRGFHGRGSDLAGTDAWCRLSIADGERPPRLYWELAKRCFTPDVFVQQSEDEKCPFYEMYQLMRVFLFADQYALRHHKSHFAVLVMAPERRATKLRRQITAFRPMLLLQLRERLQFASYESFVNALISVGGTHPKNVAQFLTDQIDLTGNE